MKKNEHPNQFFLYTPISSAAGAPLDTGGEALTARSPVMATAVRFARSRLLALAAAGMLCAGALPAAQSIIPFTAKLTDPAGKVIDGQRTTITFRLWTAATGGNNIWFETHTNMVVTKGVLSVNLGQYQDLGGIQGDNLWVGITVNSDTEMTPRLLVPTQAAPWSFPPGVVVPYFGSQPPFGWRLCDGSVLSRIDYARLFAVIGTSSGAGTNNLSFHLPDLRGVFLRGVNGTRSDTNYWDPDASLRTNVFAGGNTGNAVGSVQGDEFRSHVHAMNAGTGPHWNQCCNQNPDTLPDPGAKTDPTGGAETRPKNVYVNYIIKY
jgi:microcystin-dependent protein